MDASEEDDEAVGQVVEVQLIIIFLAIRRGLEFLQRMRKRSREIEGRNLVLVTIWIFVNQATEERDSERGEAICDQEDRDQELRDFVEDDG